MTLVGESLQNRSARGAFGPLVRQRVRRLWDWVSSRRVLLVAELALALLVLGGGVALRLQMYLGRRSLWQDEAAVALNVLERDWGGLFARLSYDQAAPAPWLVLVKLVVSVLGSGELAFRLIPLLAGLAALGVQYALGRRHLGVLTALVAAGIVALSARAVYYSEELKQYSTDQLVAALLLFLVVGLHQQTLDRRRLALLALAGGAAIWFSHPAIFVLSGASAVGVVMACGQRRWRTAGRIAALGSAWALTFGVAYLVYLRDASNNPSLISVWARYYPPLPTTNDRQEWYLQWLQQDLLNAWLPRFHHILFTSPFPYICLGLGAVLLAWRKPVVLAYVLVPFVPLFAAAALHRYPLGERLMLFMVPSLALILAAAVVEVGRSFRYVALPAGVLLAWGLVSTIAPPTLAAAANPFDRQESRPTFEYAATNWRSGDQMYVVGQWGTYHRYYADRVGIPVDARLGGNRVAAGDALLDDDVDSKDADANAPNGTVSAADLNLLRAQGRVWIVVPQGTYKGVTDTFDRIGERLDKFTLRSESIPTEALYLYAFDACTGECRVHTAYEESDAPNSPQMPPRNADESIADYERRLRDMAAHNQISSGPGGRYVTEAVERERQR